MGVSPTIRPAVEQDDAALREVDRATWSSLTSPAPVPDWSTRPHFFGPDRGPEGFLVAVLDGRVIGFVGLHQQIGTPAHAHVLTIDGLGVLPSVRGRGVGRALVEGALARAEEQGVWKVGLRVLGHNHEARRLYERCGFEVEGILRGEFHLDGRDVDDVLMARRLAGD